MSARRWLAGLLEVTGGLVRQAGRVAGHVGDGLEVAARLVDPCVGLEAGLTALWVGVVDGDRVPKSRGETPTPTTSPTTSNTPQEGTP